MEQRKKVLITNLYFQKFTGSELHVLEFAHLFKEKGYDVVIAVYKKSYPLLQELEEGITVNVRKRHSKRWNLRLSLSSISRCLIIL